MEILSYDKTKQAKFKSWFSLLLAGILATEYSHGNMNSLKNAVR